MKFLKFIVGLILVGSSAAYADQNLYDQYGGYRGRIDNNGNMYDQYGGSRGRVDSNGNIYDQYGGSRGWIGR